MPTIPGSFDCSLELPPWLVGGAGGAGVADTLHPPAQQHLLVKLNYNRSKTQRNDPDI